MLHHSFLMLCSMLGGFVCDWVGVVPVRSGLIDVLVKSGEPDWIAAALQSAAASESTGLTPGPTPTQSLQSHGGCPAPLRISLRWG